MKIRNQIQRMIYILAFVIGVIIFYNACFYPGQIYGDNRSLPDVLLIICSAIILFISILRFSNFFNKFKYRKVIYGIVVALQVAIQGYLAFHMIGVLGTDDIHVRLQIGKLLQNKYSWLPYFSYAPNNIGVVIFATWCVRFIKLLGFSTGVAINIFNLVCIDIAIGCGWIILRKLKHFKAADIYFVLVNCFSPLVLMAFIMYADVPSAMFCILGITLFIFYLKGKGKLKYLWLVLSAFFIAWASFTKENAIILLIAAILTTLLALKPKKAIITLGIFLSVFGATLATQQTLKKADNFHMIKSMNFPYTYWIALGLNPGTNGTWKPNSPSIPDPNNDTARFATKEEKNRHDVYLIKKEIHEMGFRGLLGLYSKKANEQYSMGTNGVETKSYSTRSSYFPIYEYLYGNKRDFLFFIDQIIWLIFLVGFIIETVFLTRNLNEDGIFSLILNLFIIGIFCFHICMWEVQQRYGFITLLPLIIMACLGLEKISMEKVSVKQHVLLPSTGIILIGLVLGTINSFPLTNNVQSTEIVYGHNFPTDSIELKPGEKITESNTVNTWFNRVNLNVPNDKKLEMAIQRKSSSDIKIKNGVVKHYFPAGTYNITIKNNGTKPIKIGVLKSSPLDVLGNPISGSKENYLCYNFFQNKKVVPISSVVLYGWLILMMILLWLNYLEIKSNE